MIYKHLMRLISFILVGLQLLFCNVGYGLFDTPKQAPEEDTELVNDIGGDGDMANTVLYASKSRNVVQCFYEDDSRDAYVMSNASMSLTHGLSLPQLKTATLADSEGREYIKNSFDTYYTLRDGKTYYSSRSAYDGRINTIRLGEYFYESHVRDLDSSLLAEEKFKVDKAYHIYADRIYTELSLYAAQATEALEEFGSEIVIPALSVDAVTIKDKNGVHTSCKGTDPQSTEYAAFDIKGVGVVGFIVPSDGSSKYLSVTMKCGKYIVRQAAAYESGTGVNKYDETGGFALNRVTFGFRIYNDSTHSFDAFERAAYLERNPLEGITVSAGNANAVYLGYEHLRGSYKLAVDGTDFQTAYDHPEKRFFAPISVSCDSYDRDIWFRSNGRVGCLEAAALLDEEGKLVPVPVEVCKNFPGDGGEPFYGVIDYQYGDSIFPISLKTGQQMSFTLLNLYQNWGNYPLKQLSSIEFHVSYYHLSTGTTESNCIAPYFVMKKDGWTLPDFRGRSGVMWSGQPQFNSVGMLYFMKYHKTDSREVLSEYTGAKVNSSGLSYADLEYSYKSDCGSYDYTLRHIEFPQTDENRTYYSIDVTFNRDITFKNFKRDFELFSFNGRFTAFDRASYLGEDNTSKTLDINLDNDSVNYYTLGSSYPYYSFFDVTDRCREDLSRGFGSNFALIVKDSKIISQGNELDTAFAFKSEVKNNVNIGSLTLDEERLSFNAGDTLSLKIILLPWGNGTEENDSNVLAVREDSALKPLTVTAQVGTVEEGSGFLPEVRSVNNAAQFTLTGSRNNNAVRLNGFTSGNGIRLFERKNGEWVETELASVNGDDGYTVFYDGETGLYDYSFVYTSASPDETREFKVTAK